MSDERSENQAASVFGNLPASRPGTRSPRRPPDGEGSGGPEAPEPRSELRSDAAIEPDPPPEPEPPRRRAAEAGADGAQPEEGAGGLEDLAWGGVAVAAEAATLGVRLATRAVEALRDAAARR